MSVTTGPPGKQMYLDQTEKFDKASFGGVRKVLAYNPVTRRVDAFEIDLSAYLPKSGGTLTGALNGTSAEFSGNITAAGATLRDKLKTQLLSSTNTVRDASEIDTAWTDSTDATRTSAVVIRTAVLGVMTEAVKFDRYGLYNGTATRDNTARLQISGIYGNNLMRVFESGAARLEGTMNAEGFASISGKSSLRDTNDGALLEVRKLSGHPTPTGQPLTYYLAGTNPDTVALWSMGPSGGTELLKDNIA